MTQVSQQIPGQKPGKKSSRLEGNGGVTTHFLDGDPKDESGDSAREFLNSGGLNGGGRVICPREANPSDWSKTGLGASFYT